MSNSSDANVTLTWVGNNDTLEQVQKLFHINITTNLTDQSDETQAQLFDLYEMYKTKEREQLIMYRFVAYVLGSLIILSNLIVVISSGLILKKGQQPKSTYLLLGNVSLADTIVGISIIIGTVIDHSMSSNFICVFQIGMLVCPAMVSIFSVGLIAVDRYIYIIHGLYYQRWFSTTRVRIGILCIWLIATFIASLPAMGWTGKTYRNYRCWYIALFPRPLLMIISTLVLSVIVMVCVLYILILHSAVKTVDKIREYRDTNISYINKAFQDDFDKQIENQSPRTRVSIKISNDAITEKENGSIQLHERNKKSAGEEENGNKVEKTRKVSKMQVYYGQAKALNSNPSKLKAVKTVLLVILCFVGTWAPYYVTVIIYIRCDILVNGYECMTLELLTLGPLFMLGICNSLLDPLIYAWRHSGFKKTLKRIYRKYLRNLNAQCLR